MPDRRYPETVIELLDEAISFHPAALEAVRVFATSEPWGGTIEQRKAKFRELNHALADAHGIAEPKLCFGRLDGGPSGASHYVPARHQIVLVGKLSVVTYLHEFAHALGYGEKDACRWSINLFRLCFPRQYSRLVHLGHLLVLPAEVAAHMRRRRAS
jgi:hypothetical protein